MNRKMKMKRRLGHAFVYDFTCPANLLLHFNPAMKVEASLDSKPFIDEYERFVNGSAVDESLKFSCL